MADAPLAPERPAQENPQDGLLHPAHQVFFRAGLLACREYMARFVEAESPSIAMSIRANWWPSLGQDFGPPRKLGFAEVTSGEYGTPEFRVKTAEEVSPTQEALPIALGFLQQQTEPLVPLPRSEPQPPASRRELESAIEACLMYSGGPFFADKRAELKAVIDRLFQPAAGTGGVPPTSEK